MVLFTKHFIKHHKLLLFFVSMLAFQNCTPFKTADIDSVSPGQEVKQSFDSLISNLPPNNGEQNFGDGFISSQVFDSELKISTQARFAGAVSSLQYRGKEYVNIDDHGRQIQSASSYDGLGECLNPTEAGSSPDGTGMTSTSFLKGYQAIGNELKTVTQMAYWLSANQPYQVPGGCSPAKPNIKSAQNTTDISNDYLYKQVSIGYQDLPNVISYLVTFHTNEAHDNATFEALAGYMTSEFSNFWSLDVKLNNLQSLSKQSGEQHLPVILSTQDNNHAIGVYSPDLPMVTYPAYGYGRFDYSMHNTMKFNAVYRLNNVSAGDHNFKQFIIVGTLTEVQASMFALNKKFFPDRPINGGRGPWINQGSCSKACDGGTVTQVRSCNNPVPSNGGAPCSGASSQVIACNTHSCSAPAPLESYPMIPVYRFFHSLYGHFISLSYTEGTQAGYQFEFMPFKIFDASVTDPKAVFIYRCFIKDNLHHFVSLDPQCEGQMQEGHFGKLYSVKAKNLVPVYRLYNKQTRDHLVTVIFDETKNTDYQVEGVLGYAFP